MEGREVGCPVGWDCSYTIFLITLLLESATYTVPYESILIPPGLLILLNTDGNTSSPSYPAVPVPA